MQLVLFNGMVRCARHGQFNGKIASPCTVQSYDLSNYFAATADLWPDTTGILARAPKLVGADSAFQKFELT